MSTSSDVSLGALRYQAQLRGDDVNNPAVSTPAWNSFITNSYKELYDMLVSAYGNDYYMTESPYRFLTNGGQYYPLPDGTSTYLDSNNVPFKKFYKLTGLDLQYSSSPSGFITLKRLNWIDRNKYAYPNSAVNINGYSNLRYRVQSNGVYLVPIPMAAQMLQAWYVPAPTNLQYILPCRTTLSSQTITLTDTTGLTQGMNVDGSGILKNTTISSVGSTSVVLSQQATMTQASATLSFWDDATTVDGISGWEEYIIVDATIKSNIKQEEELQALMMQKQELKMRIESMAEGRDIGQAMHVSDALGANSYGNDGFGGMGSDGGWGY